MTVRKIKTLFDKGGPIDQLFKIKKSTPEIAEQGVRFMAEETIKLAKKYILHQKNPYGVVWQSLNDATPSIKFKMTGLERDANGLPLLDTIKTDRVPEMLADSLKVMAVGVIFGKAFATIGSNHPGANTHEFGGISPITGGAIPPRPFIHPAIEQLKHSRAFKNDLKGRMAKAIKYAAEGKNIKQAFKTESSK